ncbi:MAG TPA: S41 family peptidase [Dehalococcoidia bacterium]|nr:S41 family peptidase [Dehalococcoidia bacterium]
MRTKLTRITAPIIIIAALVAVYLAGAYGLSPLVTPCPDEPEFDIVEEAWQVVVSDFVDINELDLSVLSEGAVKGMIESLDDPYSAYLTAEQYELMQSSQIEGHFGGIGAELTIIGGNLTVVSTLEGTPAEREGLMPGDVILAVDGKSTEGITLEDAVLTIRGKPGTQVTLLVLHQDEEEAEDIVITREDIKTPTVYTDILPGNISHIEITRFTGLTGQELVSELQDLLEQDIAGVILDLRDNSGGVLSAAVTVASQFLDGGIVVYAISNQGERDEWAVEKGGLATTLPLAVLVNGNSASASEVVSGALQDYRRGRLIGTVTLGKGSINHHRQLSDGSAIYITIARWYTPNGRQIEGDGLTPDDEVEITIEDIKQGHDPQLERATEYIESQL